MLPKFITFFYVKNKKTGEVTTTIPKVVFMVNWGIQVALVYNNNGL